MSHYTLLISFLGPLLKVQSTRFESKHTFFKGTIRNIHKYNNVTKRFSVKHELFKSFCKQELMVGSKLRFMIYIYRLNRRVQIDKLQEAIRKANLKLKIFRSAVKLLLKLLCIKQKKNFSTKLHISIILRLVLFRPQTMSNWQ